MLHERLLEPHFIRIVDRKEQKKVDQGGWTKYDELIWSVVPEDSMTGVKTLSPHGYRAYNGCGNAILVAAKVTDHIDGVLIFNRRPTFSDRRNGKEGKEAR